MWGLVNGLFISLLRSAKCKFVTVSHNAKIFDQNQSMYELRCFGNGIAKPSTYTPTLIHKKRKGEI